MAFTKMLRKLMQRPDVKKVFKELKKKNKTIKTKNPMKVKYSTFKQKSIINRQIINSRNFFKKEDN